MASMSRSEPVGVVAKLRFVVCLENEANYFLQQLVRPRRHAKRSHFSVWSAKSSPSPPPIQNRACELLRTRLLSVRSHLIEIPSCSNFRIRSLNTAISVSHSSWEYPSGSPLSDFFS